MSLSLRLLQALETSLGALLVAGLLAGSGATLPADPGEAVRRYTLAVEFDYVAWTFQAATVKLVQAGLDSPFTLPPPERTRLVDEYLELIDRTLQAEERLNRIYSDPSVSDPLAASRVLRRELADDRDRAGELGPLAEAVLEQEIATVLDELGLTWLGQPLPPVLFRISPLPLNLVLSRRDRIQESGSVSLLPDLTVDQQASLEQQVDAALDVSSLVVPIGGLGTYPTMVMRSTSLEWLADTIAHEWVHNWLSLRPLGLNYETAPELRTMNETAASIAGREIAALLLEQYHPSRLAAAPARPISLPLGPLGPGDWIRPVFDYRAEMHATRVRVDGLLAEGKIEEAEAYMEARRQVFWANGYAIRKLNQAFFAFHGAYADTPGGAAGEDPVGPAVRALRERSTSLGEFLKTIARLSSFAQLQAILSP